MKNIGLSLLLGFLMINISFGQSKFDDNVSVTYDLVLDEEISADPYMAMAFENSSMTMSYSEDQSRIQMNMMGGMMNIDVVGENDGRFVMFMNMMGQKMKVVPTDEEMADLKENETSKTEPIIKYFKDDTKEILGYNCYKATIDSGASVTEMYITEDIKLSDRKNLSGQGITYNNVNGFPLQTSTTQNGVYITFVAKSIDELSENAFEVNDEGYTEMSFTELQILGGTATESEDDHEGHDH